MVAAPSTVTRSAGTSMWGASFRQRLRLMPLFLAVCAADTLAAIVRPRAARHEPWQPGITVLIPERDAPALLEQALDATAAALTPVAEPHEVLVIVNGAPASLYEDLRAKHPGVRFLFHD